MWKHLTVKELFWKSVSIKRSHSQQWSAAILTQSPIAGPLSDRASRPKNVPAVIRVTSTVSVTAVNCTVTLKYIFCTYVTLMNIRSTTTTTTLYACFMHCNIPLALVCCLLRQTCNGCPLVDSQSLLFERAVLLLLVFIKALATSPWTEACMISNPDQPGRTSIGL